MTRVALFAALGALACTALAPLSARAHGLIGHVHVTGWAIENLPPGELRDFFQDPALVQAALLGAAFPDTGYSPVAPEGSREYAEAAHWEPFIEAFIEHVRASYGPTYEGTGKLAVAFLLGCASHGLQDELFDSTFLYEVEQRDGGSQENADPATDGFLVLDEYARLFPYYPGDFVPMGDLLALFEEQLPGEDITEDLLDTNLRAVMGFYVNPAFGPPVARALGQQHEPDLPWTRAHYLDAAVPGSLRAEITPTGRHMQAIWDRLHDRFDERDLVVHTWPEPPRRLREAAASSVASWVTLVFGKGVEPGSAVVHVTDEGGGEVPHTLAHTRWGGTSRLVRVIPDDDYVPGGRYTLVLEAGVTLVDGSTTSDDFVYEFQVECEGEDLERCPALELPPDPEIDGPPVDPNDDEDDEDDEDGEEPRAGGGCSASGPAGEGALPLVALVCVFVLVSRGRARRGFTRRSVRA